MRLDELQKWIIDKNSKRYGYVSKLEGPKRLGFKVFLGGLARSREEEEKQEVLLSCYHKSMMNSSRHDMYAPSFWDF